MTSAAWPVAAGDQRAALHGHEELAREGQAVRLGAAAAPERPQGARRAAPAGEILGARVEHEGAKLALIESEPEIYFTIPHFDGYSAVLVRLEVIGVEELEELIVDAWLARAPKRLARAYLTEARRLVAPNALASCTQRP